MQLTPEERRRIYEEERARIAASEVAAPVIETQAERDISEMATRARRQEKWEWAYGMIMGCGLVWALYGSGIGMIAVLICGSILLIRYVNTRY